MNDSYNNLKSDNILITINRCMKSLKGCDNY